MPTDKQIEAAENAVLGVFMENIKRHGMSGAKQIVPSNHRYVIAALTAAEQVPLNEVKQEAQPVAYRSVIDHTYISPTHYNQIILGKSKYQPLYTSPTIPEGWQLVPIEPTMQQLSAARDAWLDDTARKSSTIYRAMLAAAPKPEDKT